MDAIITKDVISGFKASLIEDEKSAATIEKYIRAVNGLSEFADGREITKCLVMEYKADLLAQNYTERSINAILAGINSLMHFMSHDECRVKNFKIQKQIYLPEEKELTKSEYIKLLDAAGSDRKLRTIMETICGTGIRVSELQFFTVEAVSSGEVHIRNKGKSRVVLVSGKLRKIIANYAKSSGIKTGIIFRNRKGEAIDRSVVWALMKKLCEKAGVAASKVFPHNLRKLFARCFYKIEKDIAKLADILGHSSIDTTRIYIMTSGQEHRRIIEQLGLVV